MKVFYFTNLPAPYRVEFLNELGMHCDLTVAFEGIAASDRKQEWLKKRGSHFKSIFLRGIRVDNEEFFCPGILTLLHRKWDRIIICGYYGPSTEMAIAWLRLRRIPFYMELDGGQIKEDSRLKYAVKHFLVSSAAAWFSSGRETTRWLSHYGADPEKCIRYPFTSLFQSDMLPAPLTGAQKRDLRSGLQISEENVIVSVGRFSWEKGYGKGFDLLMKIAEKLPHSIGIYILGDEPTQEFLDWQQKSSLSHVHFMGYKNKEELFRYYQAADLSVLLTRGDIWGLVVNESMANALPILTTDACVAGMELVQDGVNGFLVPAGDADEPYGKIVRFFSDTSMRAAAPQACLDTIREHTIENMARLHLEGLARDYR